MAEAADANALRLFLTHIKKIADEDVEQVTVMPTQQEMIERDKICRDAMGLPTDVCNPLCSNLAHLCSGFALSHLLYQIKIKQMNPLIKHKLHRLAQDFMIKLTPHNYKQYLRDMIDVWLDECDEVNTKREIVRQGLLFQYCLEGFDVPIAHEIYMCYEQNNMSYPTSERFYIIDNLDRGFFLNTVIVYLVKENFQMKKGYEVPCFIVKNELPFYTYTDCKLPLQPHQVRDKVVRVNGIDYKFFTHGSYMCGPAARRAAIYMALFMHAIRPDARGGTLLQEVSVDFFDALYTNYITRVNRMLQWILTNRLLWPASREYKHVLTFPRYVEYDEDDGYPQLLEMCPSNAFFHICVKDDPGDYTRYYYDDRETFQAQDPEVTRTPGCAQQSLYEAVLSAHLRLLRLERLQVPL